MFHSSLCERDDICTGCLHAKDWFFPWYNGSFKRRKTLSTVLTKDVCSHSTIFRLRNSSPKKATPSNALSCIPNMTSLLFLSPAAAASVLHSISISPPLHLTNHTPQFLQRTPHLHHRIPQHSRIQTQCSLDCVLCSSTAVEAANKVMACIVGDCVFSHGLG
jgi:hypothetical protein